MQPISREDALAASGKVPYVDQRSYDPRFLECRTRLLCIATAAAYGVEPKDVQATERSRMWFTFSGIIVSSVPAREYPETNGNECPGVSL